MLVEDAKSTSSTLVDDLQNIFGEIILDDSNRTGIDDFVDPAMWKSLE